MYIPNEIVKVRDSQQLPVVSSYYVVDSILKGNQYVLSKPDEDFTSVATQSKDSCFKIVKKLPKRLHKAYKFLYNYEAFVCSLQYDKVFLSEKDYIVTIATELDRVGWGLYLYYSIKILLKDKKTPFDVRISEIFVKLWKHRKKQEKSRGKAEKKQRKKQVAKMNEAKTNKTAEQRINVNFTLVEMLKQEPEFENWSKKNCYVPNAIVNKINKACSENRSRTFYTQLKNDIYKVNSFFYQLTTF